RRGTGGTDRGLSHRRRGSGRPQDRAGRRRLRRRSIEPELAIADTPPVTGLAALNERLGRPFDEESDLAGALAHRSWCAENAGHKSNERLEFLGDAVLGLIVTDFIYDEFPD